MVQTAEHFLVICHSFHTTFTCTFLEHKCILSSCKELSCELFDQARLIMLNTLKFLTDNQLHMMQIIVCALQYFQILKKHLHKLR